MIFSNVIVDINLPRLMLVFSQSFCKVSASLFDVEGLAVGRAVDPINRSLSVLQIITAKLTNRVLRTGL